MKIDTVSTLVFTIESDNPPHTTAVEFVKAAAKRFTQFEHSACTLDPGAVDRRRTEFRITYDDTDYLSRLAVDIRDAMKLIGVEMSKPEED